jgi:hypothetical protein
LQFLRTEEGSGFLLEFWRFLLPLML